MKLSKRIAGSVLGVLALGGVGAGVANAATSSAAPSTGITDTATSGDVPDAPGATRGGTTQQGDQGAPDGSGAVDIPEAGDTPDVPGVTGGDNAEQQGDVQQGDQNTPDTAYPVSRCCLSGASGPGEQDVVGAERLHTARPSRPSGHRCPGTGRAHVEARAGRLAAAGSVSGTGLGRYVVVR